MIERIKNYCQASSLFEEKFDKRYYYTLFMSLDRDCECLDVDNGTKKQQKTIKQTIKKKGKKEEEIKPNQTNTPSKKTNNNNKSLLTF